MQLYTITVKMDKNLLTRVKRLSAGFSIFVFAETYRDFGFLMVVVLLTLLFRYLRLYCSDTVMIFRYSFIIFRYSEVYYSDKAV